MKKLLFILVPSLLLVAFGGWSVFEAKQDSSEKSILRVAYNSLTKAEESLILVSPKDSQVKKVDVTDEVEAIINKNYSEKKVYKVTFNRTATETNGNLVVFVATDKQTVVGKGFDE